MNVRKMRLVLGLGSIGLASGAGAAQGLSLPAAEALWPQWQARITLLTTGGTALALAPLVACVAVPWSGTTSSPRPRTASSAPAAGS
jgi:hypothetical protein